MGLCPCLESLGKHVGEVATPKPRLPDSEVKVFFTGSSPTSEGQAKGTSNVPSKDKTRNCSFDLGPYLATNLPCDQRHVQTSLDLFPQL